MGAFLVSGGACEPPAVRMKGIVKLYPDGTLALRGVDFEACPGEIHALLGENGAGKTTLMRILYGEIQPTRGVIEVFGRRVRFRSPRDALRNGVAMVYQHLSLVPGLTVFENIYLALSAVRGMGWSEARRVAEKVAEELGFEIPLDSTVDELPLGLRQRVEIVKALSLGARILILDEPTSVLTPLEAKQLFRVVRRLRERGVTVILITHRLGEVFEAADRVTVLRRGMVAGRARVGEVDARTLARMMVGEEPPPAMPRRRSRPGKVVLSVKDVWVRGEGGGWAVRGVSLDVREGEVLGIAGVQGNGQRELVEAIAGLRPVERGRIMFGGRDVAGLTPGERYRLGMALVLDDRSVGLVLEESVVFNSILSFYRFFAKFAGMLMDWARARSYAVKLVKEFSIVTPSIDTPVKFLSGGNQQKLMIGREVARKPKLLLVMEPTHGLDVAATRYVRSLILRLRDEGVAVLLVSSDLDEVLELSDRVAVMYRGRIVAVKPPDQYTMEELGMLMGGAVEEAAATG